MVEPASGHAAPFERTIWVDENQPDVVRVIDQRRLPFELVDLAITTSEEMVEAISDMTVRGAGCIGVAASYGMFLAAVEARHETPEAGRAIVDDAARRLRASRPTAVNLGWAVDRQLAALAGVDDGGERVRLAAELAATIANEDVASCRSIGQHGLALIERIHAQTNRPVNVLTHCNAGWLAFVEYGTATAPMYAARDAGVPVHVFVGETRPRSQGGLTAWELRRGGVDHTYVADNAIGHLIQRGEVDIVIVGADRVTMRGDTANKIGTYLRALAARESGVPFYVALPSSTLDPLSMDGISEIPIEERGGDEVTHVRAEDDEHRVGVYRLVPDGSPVRNPAFDVTPAELITGLITERGVCTPSITKLAGPVTILLSLITFSFLAWM